ncbi:MAG: TolC family protein, partial [Xanthobacteraceae bacterium]
MWGLKGRGPGARTCAAAAALLVGAGLSGAAGAATLEWALVQAYQNNPQLNAQRATVRATDEAVPQALSGYRPSVSVSASASGEYTRTTTESSTTRARSTTSGEFTPYSLGTSVSQTLFDGFQTGNKTRSAEGQVSAAREALRVLEQTILLNAATVYMDMLRDTAIVEVQRSNVRVLNETLRQTRDRFEVGEVTRTDFAQSEAQFAAGQFQLLSAESTLNTTRSNYRRVIGVDPDTLSPGAPVDRFAPPALGAAIDLGLQQNPNVTAAMYGIDVANIQIKINEGALYPTVKLTGTAEKTWNSSLTQKEQTVYSSIAALTMPIYQGGGE